MIYLNNAATTYPKPKEVYEKVDYFFRNNGVNPGRSQDEKTMDINRVIFDTREKLAKFFGIEDSSNFIFTSGATMSLNLALKGYLKQNDHVISTKLEHNSVIRPLNKLQKEGRITVTFVDFNKDGIIDVDKIKEAINENTSLIVLSHASNVLGTINNIEEIAEFAGDNDIKLLVDAAQTAGILEIDLSKLKIDMLAVPGHKSLYGPPGIGGLYIKEDIDLDTIIEGGTGSNSLDELQPEIRPDKYESGTLNTLGIVGLGAGLDFIKKIGIDKIYQHERQLLSVFLKGLKEIDNIKIYGTTDLDKKVGVVSINLDNLSAAKFAHILQNRYNISVRAGMHCAPYVHKSLKTDQKGMVRFSFSYFNTLDEINETLSVIEKIAKKEG
ncbi:MAG: aminotransferase class V-fold PLP-dependent enzyme [Halanaerobiales bacterium]|nr:aminotransferase class V-fold PLP-dependent enzyme [Halanaerobiales bacterium]